ncbi:MAG: hypothetical protein ACYDCO_14290 [Armatimonadota bacterium]
MSAYTSLYVSENGDPFDLEHDTNILDANYCVPLCWLALFAADDLHISREEDGYYNVVFMTTLKQARQRFADRTPLLTSTIPAFREVFSYWARMLELIQQAYIKVEFSECFEIFKSVPGSFARTKDFLEEQTGIRIYSHEEAMLLYTALSYFEEESESSWEAICGIAPLHNYLTEQGDEYVWGPGWPNVVLGFPGANSDWLPWKDEEWWEAY